MMSAGPVDGIARLTDDLEQVASLDPVWGHAARWLLARGIAFIPTMRPGGVRKRASKFCFRNALLYSMNDEDARYCEGWALPSVGTATQHAWITYTGEDAVELTWASPGAAYFGVEVPQEVLHDQVMTGVMVPVVGRLAARGVGAS